MRRSQAAVNVAQTRRMKVYSTWIRAWHVSVDGNTSKIFAFFFISILYLFVTTLPLSCSSFLLLLHRIGIYAHSSPTNAQSKATIRPMVKKVFPHPQLHRSTQRPLINHTSPVNDRCAAK